MLWREEPLVKLPDPDDPNWLEIIYDIFPETRPLPSDDYYVIDLTKEEYGYRGLRRADELLSQEEFSNIPRINAFPDWKPTENPVVKKDPATRLVGESTERPAPKKTPASRVTIDLTEQPVVKENPSRRVVIDLTEPDYKQWWTPNGYRLGSW
jgi:hypothetical protein